MASRFSSLELTGKLYMPTRYSRSSRYHFSSPTLDTFRGDSLYGVGRSWVHKMKAKMTLKRRLHFAARDTSESSPVTVCFTVPGYRVCTICSVDEVICPRCYLMNQRIGSLKVSVELGDKETKFSQDKILKCTVHSKPAVWKLSIHP